MRARKGPPVAAGGGGTLATMGLEDIHYTNPRLGTGQNGITGIQSNRRFNFRPDAFGVSRGQINLVEDGNNL